MKISTPCFLDNLPNDAYHGDVCDSPSLSHGGAHKIMSECPALYFEESPYNPNRQWVYERKFNIGQAAHTLTLEPESWASRIVIVRGKTQQGKPSAGYGTADAKEQRDSALAENKIPLLPEEHAQLVAMRDKVMLHPVAGPLLTGGIRERSYFWRDPIFNVWLKCRPDNLINDGDEVVHFKTTARGASPLDMSKTCYDMGWHSTVPWYTGGIAAVTGHAPSRSWFVVQETEPPYLVTVTEVANRAINWGRKANRKAISVFATCLKTGDWYGYRLLGALDRDMPFVIDVPGWAEFRLADADEAGEFTVVDEDGVVHE